MLAKDRRTCQPTKIKYCRIGFVDSTDVERCTSCRNSQPSPNNTLCITNKIGNCYFGGRNIFGGLGCTNCDRGYNFDRMGKCIAECAEGCLSCFQLNGKCLACNHFNGYYEIGPGSCKKTSKILGAGLLLVAYFILQI